MIVSARVVNTNSLPSPTRWPRSSRISCGNAKRTPWLFPIQFVCIVRTRSGQPSSRSSVESSSSA
jgi:hypothetical protein